MTEKWRDRTATAVNKRVTDQPIGREKKWNKMVNVETTISFKEYQTVACCLFSYYVAGCIPTTFNICLVFFVCFVDNIERLFFKLFCQALNIMGFPGVCQLK